MMGRYIPPTDTNDGALFLPLTPMMGLYSSHSSNVSPVYGSQAGQPPRTPPAHRS
ncbi:unnamed protein product, partial [Staurois parvus]